MTTNYHIHSKVKTPLTERVLQIFTRVVSERCGISVIDAPITSADLVLDVQPGIGVEGYRIADLPGGQIAIIGDSDLGLLYGVGKFLHDARYDEYQFVAGSWRGISVPQCSLRGIYFALHENFYDHASLDELECYMEDLALWGINTIAFHLLRPDPDSSQPDTHVISSCSTFERHHELLLRAKHIGMRIALLDQPNIGYGAAPKEAYAAEFPDTTPARRGFNDIRICPSHPAGFAYLSQRMARYIDGFQDIGIDYVVAFPYDSGGCGCSECWPWGSRGYLTISKEFVRLARLQYPEVKFILGTWCFDVCEEPDGEWEGLTQALAEDRSWIQYIMADSHFEFPRYPLDQGVPGGLPLINFAEISMWGRFPWGGFGANPLPERFQRIWDETEGKLDGGLPYSEGNF